MSILPNAYFQHKKVGLRKKEKERNSHFKFLSKNNAVKELLLIIGQNFTCLNEGVHFVNDAKCLIWC